MQVLFFDGECILCNGFAHKVAKLNTTGNLYFASLQSKLAVDNLDHTSLEFNSVVFIDHGHTYLKSEAFFEVLKYIPSLRWLRVIRFLPKRFLDYVYDWVANNRIKWFGKQEYCDVPSKEFRGRYISD